jgi:hypothetical protein
LQKLSHPTVDARVNGRYDLTDTMALNGEGHVAVDADDPGTARFTNLYTKIPLVTTVGGSAGFAQKFDTTPARPGGAFATRQKLPTAIPQPRRQNARFLLGISPQSDLTIILGS